VSNGNTCRIILSQNSVTTQGWIRSLHYSVGKLVLLIVKTERYSCVSPPYQEHGCVAGRTAPCILKPGTRWREIISFSIRSLFITEEKISSNSEPEDGTRNVLTMQRQLLLGIEPQKSSSWQRVMEVQGRSIMQGYRHVHKTLCTLITSPITNAKYNTNERSRSFFRS